MTLLTTIQNACNRVGLAVPGAAASSGDRAIKTMVALANEEGLALSRRHDWQVLTLEKTFTSTASETQSGVIPAGFDRFVNDSAWNRTEREPIFGPLDPQTWQALKASNVGPTVNYFRQRGGNFIVTPTPAAGDTWAYEYVTKYWVAVDGATTTPAKAAFTLDTDVSLLDEELITLGIEWRWLKRQQMAYADAYGVYDAEVKRAIGKDGGRTTLTLMGTTGLYEGARRPHVPDGSWNL